MMKFHSGRRRPWFGSGQAICLALAVGVLCLAGCHKKGESASSSPNQTAPAAASPAAPANAVARSTAAPAVVVAAPDLSPLTQALHIYIFQHKTMPKTFADLVAAGYIKKMPPLPPGKKLEISSTTAQIIMVDQ